MSTKRPLPPPSHPLPSASSSTQTSKKPRFDARNPSTLAASTTDPETTELDDLILDADVIGRSGAQSKRNAVRLEGYESDSEEEGFDVRDRERRAKLSREQKSTVAEEDEDEGDMFADLEAKDGDDDEELAREGKISSEKRGKKDVRFLEQKDIVGQVMGSTSGGHVSAPVRAAGRGGGKAAATAQEVEDASDSESSGEEETRALPPADLDPDLALEIGAGGKKKHAPRLDAFNLRDEEEEGKFDESGNYIRLATDPDASNDTWLEGLSRKDMRKAKAAQEAREEAQRKAAAEKDALLTSDLLGTLIGLLESGETVLEALQRLNKSTSGSSSTAKKIPKWKKQKKPQPPSEAMVLDSPTDTAADSARRRETIESLTAAADALYSRAQHEIYDTEREMLMRQYSRETGEDWRRPTSLAAQGTGGAGEEAKNGDSSEMWVFRWSDARDGGAAHGPYDAATMKAWEAAGYFGEGVEFRRQNEEGEGEGEWSRVLDLS